MAEETTTTTEEETTPPMEDTDDITTIEGQNKPIIDIMGQQGVGAVTPGTEEGPTDITSGVDLGAGAYQPTDQTYDAATEKMTGPTDLTATGAAATASQVESAAQLIVLRHRVLRQLKM